jgi:hypothetical protein
MVRAQIILDDWQHEWLSEQARQHSTSMSALVRELLTEAIERRQIGSPEEDPLWGIIGIGAGPDDGISSENLDEFLYRSDWHDRPVRKVSEDDTTDS